jgi:predicted DNA-binding protein
MKKKTKLLQVRVTEEQHDKFTSFANNKDVTKSGIIRDFINRVIRKQLN